MWGWSSRAEEFAEPLSEAVHRDAGGGLGQPEFASQSVVGDLASGGGQAFLERIELISFAMADIFRSQACQRCLKECHGPLAFEDPVRR